MASPQEPLPDAVVDAATLWFARRDRGLRPGEQDAYFEWLQASPLHGEAMRRQERLWCVLNKLDQWRPAHSATSNPDLLLAERPSRRRWWFAGGLAAAAALALLAILPESAAPGPTPRREAIIHPAPERLALPDGSLIELNRDAQVDVLYSATERRIRLTRGEAHFIVAKARDRPFIVEAGSISARAVGTAFTVRMVSDEVSVLVTEGRVQVTTPGDAVEHLVALEPVAGELPPIVDVEGGQRVILPLAPDVPAVPVVQDVTPVEIERALAWQGIRLEFVDMHLSDVVATFNRYNHRQLRIGDPAIRSILVGGNFRADNVEGFVRLLESSFGVIAENRMDGVVLRRLATP